MDAQTNIRRALEFLPLVVDQCRRQETRAVQQAVDRLVAAGATPDIAMLVIAAVLGAHIERSKEEKRNFDYDAYVGEIFSLTSPTWND